MIKTQLYTQGKMSFQFKRFYVFLPILLAVFMLMAILGTTAVYAAAPVITPGQTFTVNENSANGWPVGTVATTGDPAIAFSIVAGNIGNAFDIDNSGNIVVQTGTAIDFETIPIFTLTIQATNIDGSVEEDVVINVNDVNDAPVVPSSHSYAIAENNNIGDLVGTIVATDQDGNVLSYSVIQWLTAPGPFLLNGSNGNITATAQLDYETDLHEYRFVVQVSDGGASNNTIVTINLIDGNDAPVAVDDMDAAYTIAENNTLNITTPTVLDNDSDGDGDGLTAVNASTPANGAVTLNPDGTFSYTPTAGFDGVDTFTYQAQDDGIGNLLSNVATVYITVTGNNDAPTALDNAYSTPEDIPLTVNAPGILENDTDPENDSLTAVLDTDVQNGTLTLNPDGSFTYTPDPDFVGEDTFTYQANDSEASSNLATVTITVTSENDPPTATDDTLTVAEDSGTTSVDVLANDSFAPDTGETLSIIAVGTPDNGGTAVINGSNIDYTPALNFNGTEVFTYTISDGNGGEDTANVTVTVTPDNDAPVITETSPADVTMSEDGNPTPFNAITLNATDVENDDSTLVWSISTPASNGTANATTPGSASTITYVPNADYYGSDSFVVEVSDGVDTDTFTVNVTIESVNDNPDAVDDTLTVTEDSGTTSVDVMANDTIAPDTGETLSLAAVGVTDNGGTAVINGSNIDYAPASNFAGTEVFTYTISDGNGGEDTATVTVTVTPDNDDPVIAETSPANVTMSEDGNPTPFSVITLNATDVDNDDGSLDWSISTVAANGVASVSPTTDSSSTDVDYTPNPDYNGSDSFVVEVSDGAGGTDTFTVNVTIEPVNDNPDAVDDTPTVDEQSSNNTLDVLSNDTDAPDTGETLTITAVGATDQGGTATNNGTNITYTPDPVFIGTEVFTYTISDGNGGTDTATVTVTVQDVNFAPVIDEGTSTTVDMDEDSMPTAFSLTLNATDADNDTLTWSISSQASNGTASASGDGLSKAIDYTPDADYNGTDSFVVRISDGNGGTDDITVNVNIAPQNDDPDAVDDTPTVDEQSSNNTLDVLSNDTDAPDTGETLTITAVGATDQGGTATNNGTNITYTPDPVFIGTEVFTYTISDGNGGTDTATVTVTVQDVNFAPVIDEGTSTTVDMDEDSTPTAFSLTLNATDADNDTLTWSISSQASNGTASTSGDGLSKAIDYTPDADYNGTDSFVVQVSDNNGGTDTITVNVNIAPQNDDPTAVDDDASTPLDTAVNIDVLDNDIDIDGDTLTVLSVTNGISGTVTNHGTHVEYTPDVGFEGTDTFTYITSDSNGGTSEATVTVVVGRAYTVFLPMIVNNYTSAPDLVVTNMTASSDLIEVVIENQGTAPVTTPFWVDFYINPTTPPTAANDLWPEQGGTEGLAWGVTDNLAVGQTITLTYSTAAGAPNLYFVPEESVYGGVLPAGTPVYAQVDSAHAEIDYGAVQELDELGYGPYNNILAGTAVSSSSTSP